MSNAPYVYFCPDNYKNGNIHKDISDLIFILIKNGYEVLIHKEDDAIIVKFLHRKNREFGDNSFEVVTSDEYEELYWYRQNKQVNSETNDEDDF